MHTREQVLVCACACVRARACMRVWVCLCAHAHVHALVVSQSLVISPRPSAAQPMSMFMHAIAWYFPACLCACIAVLPQDWLLQVRSHLQVPSSVVSPRPSAAQPLGIPAQTCECTCICFHEISFGPVSQAHLLPWLLNATVVESALLTAALEALHKCSSTQ